MWRNGALSIFLVGCAACSSISGLGEYTVAKDGEGGDAGSGGQDGGSGGAAGGADGGGGSVMGNLRDDGLVSRYFIDEAASGIVPPELRDVGPAALNLPIVYDTNLTYTERDGHRGLWWQTPTLQQSVVFSLANSAFVDAINGSPAATVEIVLEQLVQGGGCPRVVHVGNNDNGQLTVCFDDILDVRVNNTTALAVSLDLVNDGRHVIHAVVDTTEPTAAERVRLYVDGAIYSGANGTIPVQDAPIVVDSLDNVTIGNRADKARTFGGIVYYVGFYDVVFTAQRALEHAVALIDDDDAPARP